MGPNKAISLAINKALVTGGGGFVGKAVTRQLLELGVETSVLGRNHYPEMERLGARCIVGNISDKKIMAEATKGIDAVFHVAALAGIWGAWKDYYTTNVLGTEVVLDSCRNSSVPILVYTSTPSVVFNRQDIEGGDESLPYATKYLCNYAKSKVMAEKMVLEANSTTLLTCALRPHLIWGPGDPHLLPRLLDSGRQNNLKQVGDGTNLVDISYIDNVAHSHIMAAKNLSESATAAGKPYFISQGTPVNLWDWINDLFQAMDIDKIQSSVSFSAAYRIGALMELFHKGLQLKHEPKMTRFLAEQLAKSHFFTINSARKDLGYSPLVSTFEGLEKTISWLKDR